MLTKRKWAEFASKRVPRSGKNPYVSLNDRGIIVLNRLAYTLLGEPEAVLLLFDIDNLAIGLRPSDILMPNAFPVSQRANSGTRAIQALTFTNAHQIFVSGTIRFLNPKMEDGVLVCDLNHTARTTQSPRTGWRKQR